MLQDLTPLIEKGLRYRLKPQDRSVSFLCVYSHRIDSIQSLYQLIDFFLRALIRIPVDISPGL